MSREMTKEEMRAKLLDHVWIMVKYWDEESRATDSRSKLEGLAFSILVALDGGAAMLPGSKVIPLPHPTDKAYCQSVGEDWYPDDVDIGGGLHEEFHSRRPK